MWLTPRERDDPLEPLSLEPGRPDAGVMPPPVAVPGAPIDSLALPLPPPSSSRRAGRDSTRDAERVVVVTCNQLLIDDPQLAERLARLLRAGAALEDAKRALGRTDLEPRRREYALDELAPEIRSTVEQLPEGGWSPVRPWRGRSALFQVVAKAERERGSIPDLGEGLGQSELDRLALQRSAARQRSSGGPAFDPAQQYQPAAVVQQVVPEYPAGLTGSGDVVVQVEIGPSDDVTSSRVLSSFDRQFDQAATDAAQHSRYRSARRKGTPEAGSVTLTFKFVAPGEQPNPADPTRRD
jgi:TonB family protein